MTGIDPPNLVIVASKPWWQSRTLWVCALTVLAGLGSIQVDGKVGSAVAIVSGLAISVLRLFTNGPIAGTAAAVPKDENLNP